MINKINIEEVLSRHSSSYKIAVDLGRTSNAVLKDSEVKAAIKNIIEQVVNKCAEEAKVIKKHDWMEGQFISDSVVAGEHEMARVHKPSILNVKNMIDYD